MNSVRQQFPIVNTLFQIHPSTSGRLDRESRIARLEKLELEYNISIFRHAKPIKSEYFCQSTQTGMGNFALHGKKIEILKCVLL